MSPARELRYRLPDSKRERGHDFPNHRHHGHGDAQQWWGERKFDCCCYNYCSERSREGRGDEGMGDICRDFGVGDGDGGVLIRMCKKGSEWIEGLQTYRKV